MGLKAMTELADLKAELDLWDRMARLALEVFLAAQAPSAPRVPTAHKASLAPKATKVTKVTLAPLVSVDLQAKKACTELQAKMEALVDQAIAVLLVSKAPVEGLVQEVSPARRATTAVRALQVLSVQLVPPARMALMGALASPEQPDVTAPAARQAKTVKHPDWTSFTAN